MGAHRRCAFGKDSWVEDGLPWPEACRLVKDELLCTRARACFGWHVRSENLQHREIDARGEFLHRTRQGHRNQKLACCQM